MLALKKVHHIAIICSDYQAAKHFYTQILGLKILREVYRKNRNSYKLDLALGNDYVIELFSFENSPKRLTQPEATGLRHLAFEVENIEACVEFLQEQKIAVEPIRIDEFTQKRFTFLQDLDGLPIELYEV